MSRLAELRPFIPLPTGVRLQVVKAVFLVIGLLAVTVHSLGIFHFVTQPEICPQLAETCVLTTRQLTALQKADFGLGAYLFVLASTYVTRLLVFSAVGVILLYRLPDANWAGLVTALGLLTFADPFLLRQANLLIPALTPLSQAIVILSWTLVPLVFGLFPTGQLRPRWLWVVIFGWLAVMLLSAIGLLPFNPLSAAPATFNAYIIVLAISAIGQAIRYTTVATPEQRQQTRTVVAIFLVTMLVFIVLYSLDFTFLATLDDLNAALFQLYRSASFSLAEILTALAFLAAIWRYRLWETDLALNRSLTYGGVTLVLASAFVVLLFLIQAVFLLLTNGRQTFIATVTAALAVGFLFQPTLQAVRRAINENFYNIRIPLDARPLPTVQLSVDTLALGNPLIAPADATLADAGQFTDLELIGRGGMGAVFRGRHPRYTEPVAIKILASELLENDTARQRFQREVAVAARLKHPNIVRLLDSGISAGRPYLVMRYIPGHNLAEYTHGQLPLDLPTALPLLTDIAAALDYLQSQGVIHRDIKPSNVLIHAPPGHPPRALLTDFGLARLRDGSRFTRTGIMGTLEYIAPEQIQMSPDIDHRADLYAFGVLAYELLAGRVPFQYPAAGALLMAHLYQPAPDPRTFNPALLPATVAALQTALAKAPAERYPSASAFLAALSA